MLNRRPLRGLFSCRRFQPLLRHFVAALKVNGKKNPAALATLKEIIKKVRCMHGHRCVSEYPDRNNTKSVLLSFFFRFGSDDRQRSGYSFANHLIRARERCGFCQEGHVMQAAGEQGGFRFVRVFFC